MGGKLHKLFLALLPGLLALSVALAEETAPPDSLSSEVSLEVQLDKNDVTIGDIIHYTVTILAPSDRKLTLPPMGQNLGNFLIRDYDTNEETLPDGRRKISHVYTMAAYFLGDRPIPPFVVKYADDEGAQREVASPDLLVKVQSVATDQDEGLRPPKDVKAVPVDRRPLYRAMGIGVGAILLLGVGGYLIWRRLSAEKILPEPPPRPAYDVAMEALARLRTQEVGNLADAKELYFELSYVLREYLGRVFALDLLERTTEEVRQELKAVSIASEVYSQLMELLADTDIVKFADYLPTPVEREKHLGAAEYVIEATRPQQPGPSEPPEKPLSEGELILMGTVQDASKGGPRQ